MLTVKHYFPLDRVHKGAELGNGHTGEIIWGSGNTLNITVGCADLWDHRGGMPWLEKQNFKAIRTFLEAGRMDKVQELFKEQKTGEVRRPSLIPAGRLVITLSGNAELLRFEQTPELGCTKVFYEINGTEKALEFHADMTMKEAFSCSGLDDSMGVELIPSMTLCKNNPAEIPAISDSLSNRGFPDVQEYTFGNAGAFIQPMAADPSFAMLYNRTGNTLTLGFRRGISEVSQADTDALLPYENVKENSLNWWRNYWKDTPKIKSDNPDTEELYYLGLYKYGVMTNPAGVTPGLQGPWIEDDMLPPWSGDYHFNINVQLCNLPGFKAGKFANIKMLFDLVLSWKEQLRRNAKCFLGIDDGYMLPHAVDDRCVCMGGFWSGSIDHACSAWIAMLMADYCEYSGNMEFLKNEVYDFMCGVMRVYCSMLDEKEDGTLELPVSVSPEYGGCDGNCWGKNASFQLAAIHRLNRELLKISKLLNKEPDPAWLKIEEKLPEFCLSEGEIALWDGLLLERSHRHHSHLAGICPFDVIDPMDEKYKDILSASLERWYFKGFGEWAGWSMGWASQIHTRIGNGNMSELMIKLWKECFTNDGGGSQHDAEIKGFTVVTRRNFIMQSDGIMAVTTAIQDQFLHAQNGILRAFFGISSRTRNTSFEGMYAPGGFRISGEIGYRQPVTLKVESTRDAVLKIQTRNSKVFEKAMKQGEVINLKQIGDKLLEY